VIRAEDLAAFGSNEPGSAAAAAHSAQLGVTIEYLLEFTREHNCWHFPTWKVVTDIIKPATRARRQRFAELDAVQATGAVGRADTFASHCWGALWGLLVASLADQADVRRRVWVDVFAVRQWAGNEADHAYDAVVPYCTSFAICCQASPTKQIQGVNCLASLSNSEMLARRIDLVPERIRTQIAFLRAWSLLEIMRAVEAEARDKHFAVVMKVGNVAASKDSSGGYAFQSNSDMTKALQNLIDVRQAEARDPADAVRILAAAAESEGSFELLNDRVRSCITGARACSSFPEIQAAACGDEVLDLTGSSQKKVNDWLKAASGAGYPWIVQKLLEHGGQPNTICTGNVTPLMSAVMSGNLEVAEMLLAKCPDRLAAVNRQRDDGTTPVNLAAGAGQAGAVQWLIERGADVNLIQTNGNAPLKRASQNGYTECCVLCLRAGAHPNHVNKQGETALHYAAKNNHFDCVKALVEGGCDWTVANPDGYVKGTAADWADHTGHVEISEWLRRQPAGSGIGTTFSSSADQGA